MRELIYYCTVSLDGKIADAQGSTSWMHGAAGEDYGFADFYREVSALLLGRVAYEQMLSTGDFFPYADKPVFVFSHNADLRRAAECVQIISDTTPEVFVARLKLHEVDTGPLWLGGGAQLATTLLTAGLVDEIVLHVQPLILGAGLPFLGSGDIPACALDLQECQEMPAGFVKLRYRTVKSWRADI
ncbi:MAG: dihydrofolate reductase family protein [Actinomycetia bacterium]|nr:dihydrofolate reductase family protein [Actinomycetes bacterium]